MGEKFSIPMLRGQAEGFHEDDLCSATRLPTFGERLDLVLVKPHASTDEVMQGWAAEGGAALQALLDSVADPQENAEVEFPRFAIRWKNSARSILESLGVTTAFSPEADFTGISADGDLLLTDVLHEAVIRVDENGMEAAAATAVLIGVKSAPVQPRKLTLDGPFLFIAVERQTGTPLVIGRVFDPRIEE